MPVLDGFEAAAQMDRLQRPPAVLMLTGSSLPEDKPGLRLEAERQCVEMLGRKAAPSGIFAR